MRSGIKSKPVPTGGAHGEVGTAAAGSDRVRDATHREVRRVHYASSGGGVGGRATDNKSGERYGSELRTSATDTVAAQMTASEAP